MLRLLIRFLVIGRLITMIMLFVLSRRRNLLVVMFVWMKCMMRCRLFRLLRNVVSLCVGLRLVRLLTLVLSTLN